MDFWYYEYDGFWISCAAIVLSIIEIILAIVLFYSVKKVRKVIHDKRVKILKER